MSTQRTDAWHWPHLALLTLLPLYLWLTRQLPATSILLGWVALNVIALAGERGYASVVMKSHPTMVGAHALYRKLAFARDPARDGLWEGGEKILDLYAFRIRVQDVAPEEPA